MSINPSQNPSGNSWLHKNRFLIMGFILGVVAAASVWILFIQSGQKVGTEKDDAPTLAKPEVGVPKVALRPWTLGEISRELGFAEEKEFLENQNVWAKILQDGVLRDSFLQDCETGTRHSSLCWVVKDYFERQTGIFATAERPSRKKNLIFNVKTVDSLQREDFGRLLSRMPDWDTKRLRQFSEVSLATTSCPRNFSLGLSRKWEIHLNSDSLKNRASEDLSYWQIMRRLEGHGLECLDLKDPSAEFGFFRAGLWDFAEGNLEGALKNFQKALIAETRREEYRVLSWLQKTLKALGRLEEAKNYENQLKTRFPISWFTLQIQAQNGEDPLVNFASRPLYPDIQIPTDENHRRRFFWLLALMDSPEPQGFAVKRYGEFFIRNLESKFEPGFMQFLARNLDRTGFHRLQILGLSQLAVAYPEAVNLETLRLLFPMPFFDELDRASPKFDTAVLLGLARQESGFDPTATSGVNARGLLQVMPATAKEVRRGTHKDELYELEKNVEVGARFFMRLIRLFDGSIEKSLAAYNAGQGTLKKWEKRYGFAEDTQLFLDLMPYRETRDYVPSILRNAYWYHRLFPVFTEKLEANSLVTSELLLSTLQKTRDQN